MYDFYFHYILLLLYKINNYTKHQVLEFIILVIKIS